MSPRALEELKTRARVRLNAARRDGDAEAGKLRDVLHEVARECGFAHWEHARRVLAGEAQAGEDFGSFWYSPRTGTFNRWFARHADAREALAATPSLVLLPYRRQFVVVEEAFVRALGLDPAAPEWEQVGHDVAAGYGTPAWAALAWARSRAPRESFE